MITIKHPDVKHIITDSQYTMCKINRYPTALYGFNHYIITSQCIIKQSYKTLDKGTHFPWKRKKREKMTAYFPPTVYKRQTLFCIIDPKQTGKERSAPKNSESCIMIIGLVP